MDRNMSQRRQEPAPSALTRCTRPCILIRIQCFVPGPAASTSSRCTAVVEPDCVAKINSTVWQKHQLLPPPMSPSSPDLQTPPRKPVGSGKLQWMLVCRVLLVPCSAFNSTLPSCKSTPLPWDRRRDAKAKDEANWQSKIHLSYTYLPVVHKPQPPGTFQWVKLGDKRPERFLSLLLGTNHPLSQIFESLPAPSISQSRPSPL